jgi:ribosome maturation factor RimP
MGLAPIFCFCGLSVKDEELLQLITPAISDLGLECLGIEYVPGRGSSLLRVYIDVEGRGVTVDDCEAVSRELSALLDVNDPISGQYRLEVSSPGLDRILFTPAQFTRFIGETIKVALNLPIDGRRRLQGRLKAVEGDLITVDQDGVDVTVVHDNIQKARLVPDLVALGLAPAQKPGGKPGSRKPKN